MFCGNCGREIPEGADKCPGCGMEMEKSNINLSDFANRAGERLHKAASAASSGMQKHEPEQSGGGERVLSDMIVDSDEKQIAVLGSGYLASLLHGGGLSKGFGILTDKRFYFKGKCFTKVGGHHKLVDEEYTVDLNNITATGFVYARKYWILICAIVIAVVFALLGISGGDETLLFMGIVAGAILLIVYTLAKRAVYEVYFEG